MTLKNRGFEKFVSQFRFSLSDNLFVRYIGVLFTCELHCVLSEYLLEMLLFFKSLVPIGKKEGRKEGFYFEI